MLKIFVSLLVAATIVAALHATSISNCPGINPRHVAPKDITDLRADDIKIFGALGDSVVAGYGVNNINSGIFGLINTTSLVEFRGLNYLMGGDPDAITVANFMKRYNPDFRGRSVGYHELRRLQRGKSNLYLSEIDQLNAAKSAAMAQDLDIELDYLIKKFDDTSIVGNDATNTWKMITINIGSNDLCASCRPEFLNVTTAEAYGDYVEGAVKRLEAVFPNNTLINLMGVYKIVDLIDIPSKNHRYCFNRALLRPCSCLYTPENIENISKLTKEYDNQLKSIAEKYAAKPESTFGVVFTPMNADLASAPVEILSNIDCFHPSLLGHEYLAKVFWNQLFVKNELRPSLLPYNKHKQIYCPTEQDRVQVS